MGDLRYDARTSTVFSDGHSTAEENVRAAEACGLSCIVLAERLSPETSHDDVLQWLGRAEALDAQSPVKVLGGVSCTVQGVDGRVAVDDAIARSSALVYASLGMRTRGVGEDPPASAQRYADNVIAATENAAANPLVDAIACPFNLGRFEAALTPAQFAPGNLRRIARAMCEHNAAFEIANQAHWWYPQMTVAEFTRDYGRLLRIFADENVKFVVGSGARSAGAVGNLRYCRLLMQEAGIELSQLVDLTRMAQVRQESDR